MAIAVRLITITEVDLIIDYFWQSTPEHLEMLGVDPTRLPTVDRWRKRFQRELTLPPGHRATVIVIWLLDDFPVGFSTADKIVDGEQANMHLHIVDPQRRGKGMGVECVRQTADLYFEILRLKRLFCEPNAFNVAPNRTVQKAGFRYVKTYMTVPGPLNFHQAVNRWVLERSDEQASDPPVFRISS